MNGLQVSLAIVVVVALCITIVLSWRSSRQRNQSKRSRQPSPPTPPQHGQQGDEQGPWGGNESVQPALPNTSDDIDIHHKQSEAHSTSPTNDKSTVSEQFEAPFENISTDTLKQEILHKDSVSSPTVLVTWLSGCPMCMQWKDTFAQEAQAYQQQFPHSSIRFYAYQLDADESMVNDLDVQQKLQAYTSIHQGVPSVCGYKPNVANAQTENRIDFDVEQSTKENLSSFFAQVDTTE